MNTNDPTLSSPPSLALDDSNSVKIAIVMELPIWLVEFPKRVRENIQWLGLESPLFLHTAARLLEKTLRAEVVPCDDMLWRGVGYDGVIRFRTAPINLEDGLKAAVAFVKDYPILDEFSTVAWFDAAEEAWREHRRGSIQIPLDEFFAPARQQVRHDDMERTSKVLDEFFSAANPSHPIDPQ